MFIIFLLFINSLLTLHPKTAYAMLNIPSCELNDLRLDSGAPMDGTGVIKTLTSGPLDKRLFNDAHDYIYRYPMKAPTSKGELCGYAQKPYLFQDMLLNESNDTGLENDGGFLVGKSLGMCWWQSRFTRFATYLSIYRPSSPPPDQKQAEKIISSLISGEKVAVIPGYKNLSEFSQAWKPLLKRKLEEWQASDTTRFEWTKFFEGGHYDSKEKLWQKMQDIYREVELNKGIAYVMLRNIKIGAHSSLVLRMTKKKTGYEMIVLDPNNHEYTYWEYKFGANQLENKSSPYKKKFVPYLQHGDELERIRTTLSNYCKK